MFITRRLLIIREYTVIDSLLWKDFSLYHKLWFSNRNIFAAQCRRPLIFQTINSVRSNNLGLKYQRFTRSGCKDAGIKKSEFVAKTQFLTGSWGLLYIYVTICFTSLTLNTCNISIVISYFSEWISTIYRF